MSNRSEDIGLARQLEKHVRSKLHHNAHKPHWRQLSITECLARAEEEIRELWRPIITRLRERTTIRESKA